MPNTREGLKRTILGLRAAIPDLRFTLDEIVVAGDKVWARMTAYGTNTGPFMGRPPTGKPYTITVIDICRFADGKIVEHWGVPDRFAMLDQLGLLRPPALAGDGFGDRARSVV
jgi:predicted ester cyclase